LAYILLQAPVVFNNACIISCLYIKPYFVIVRLARPSVLLEGQDNPEDIEKTGFPGQAGE